MKKTYILFFFAFLSINVFAQNESHLKFGIKGGLNLNGAKIKFTYEGADIESKTITSFGFGSYVDYAVSSSISIQSGLTLNGKGGKIQYHGSQEVSVPGLGTFNIPYKGDSTINLMYIELPLNFIYKINHIYFGAGPYYAYALSGKTKYNFDASGYSTRSGTNKVEFGDDNYTQLKRSDYGINFLFGYQLESGLNFNAGYGLGLRNLVPKPPGDYKIKNSTISVCLGYSF